MGPLQVLDGQGHFSPEFDESRSRRLDADLVLLAVGLEGDLEFCRDDPDLSVTRWASIEADESGATSEAGVFAAGDIVTGPRSIVEAIDRIQPLYFAGFFAMAFAVLVDSYRRTRSLTAGGVGQGQVGSTQTNQHAAQNGVRVAGAIDINAHRIGGGRALANCAQVQARPGLVNVIRG